MLRKMQRHVVVPPTLDGEGEGEVDITEQLVSSILEQGHLCPLPLHVRPIYWELDYTLRLTPLPHLVRQHCHSTDISRTESNSSPHILLIRICPYQYLSLLYTADSLYMCALSPARARRPCGLLLHRAEGMQRHQSWSAASTVYDAQYLTSVHHRRKTIIPLSVSVSPHILSSILSCQYSPTDNIMSF